MTDYAVTVRKREGHLKDSTHIFNNTNMKIDREKYVLYQGSEGNGNWHLSFWINKDDTAAADNDTITLTVE